jgi:hypothetical protein
MDNINPILVFVVPDASVWSGNMPSELPIGWDANGTKYNNITDINCCVILMSDRTDSIGDPVHTNHDADEPLLVIEHSDKQGEVSEDWGRYCRIASFHHMQDNPVVQAVNGLLDGKLSAIEFAGQWNTKKRLQDLDALAAICQAGILGAENISCEEAAAQYLGELEADWNEVEDLDETSEMTRWEYRLRLVTKEVDSLFI